MFRVIDTHCHLDFPDYDNDREILIKNILDSGIGMITIGTDIASSKKAVEIAGKYAGVYASIGVHPHNLVSGFKEEFYDLVKNEKVAGIGECGLDYFGENIDKKAQKDLFVKQIELAAAASKTLVVHSRESYKETHEILKKYTGKLMG